MKLENFIQNPQNPWKYSEDDLQDLIQKILRLKLMKLRPIVYDPEQGNMHHDKFIILGGNKRFAACERLATWTDAQIDQLRKVNPEVNYDWLETLRSGSFPDGWIVSAEGLSEEDKREFIFADNKTYGEINFEFVTEEEAEEWGFEWEAVANEDKTTITPKSEKFKSKDPNISNTDFKKLAGYETAINRREPSAPIQWLLEKGLIVGDVLDYGSGMDAHAYDSFDPAFDPDYTLLHNQYDTVICNYVINVIPLEHNRFELIRTLQTLVKEGGNIYLSIYGKDSVDTETDQSFQCGWSLIEWKDFLDKCCSYEIINSTYWTFRIG